MKQILHKINALTNIGILLCSIASFFFLPDYDANDGIFIISLTASIILLIMGLAVFVHGVVLPDRETWLGKRRSWSPGTMFVILVVGSFLFFPAILMNSFFYYGLCLLGAGIFILILFVLSFFYEYYDSKENQDDRFKKTVIGILAAFLIFCVLDYLAYTNAPKYEPFNNYEKVEQQLRQWESFKEEHPELFSNETDNGNSGD